MRAAIPTSAISYLIIFPVSIYNRAYFISPSTSVQGTVLCPGDMSINTAASWAYILGTYFSTELLIIRYEMGFCQLIFLWCQVNLWFLRCFISSKIFRICLLAFLFITSPEKLVRITTMERSNWPESIFSLFLLFLVCIKQVFSPQKTNGMELLSELIRNELYAIVIVIWRVNFS